MKTIVGKFTDSYDGRPAANAILTLKLDRGAEIIATGEEVEFDYMQTVQLDEWGRIPPGTRILSNDELSPEETSYEVRVCGPAEGGGMPRNYYHGWLNLIGPEPIDLNPLDPELDPKPQPKPEPAPPPLPPRRPGVNYDGFFGGVINCPAGEAGSIGIRNTLSNTIDGPASFATFAFFLPFKAIVKHVSIFVDVPHLGNSVVVELRRMNGKKVCGVGIDVSKDGVAAGTLDSQVELKPGEYTLAWATNIPGRELRVRSAVPEHAPQLALANTCPPILAYFKA